MKIRTDFVTNSSSSSFVVSISVEGENGLPLRESFRPDMDGNGEPNLRCTADELLRSKSLDDLLRLLSNAICDEHFGGFNDKYRERMLRFTDSLKNRFSDISEITRISLSRHWNAWGEMASCMIWNNDRLQVLSDAVCSAQGENEKQAAVQALKDYLDTEPAHAYGEAVDWPTGFMGSDAKGSFVWDSTPESLARYVSAKMISPDDSADEVTVIDLKKHIVEQNARYYLRRTGELPCEDHEFRIIDGELKQYKGPGGDIVIPDGITEIGSDAFRDCRNIKSVRIPKGVKRIGMGAFLRCTSLLEITVPDTVSSIDWFAFENCSSLRAVSIPKAITSIGVMTFQGCRNLQSITLPDGLKMIWREAFSGCEKLSSVFVPEEVTIGSGAFKGCNGLADADGLVIINGILFDYFGARDSVVIPENVRIISQKAFANKRRIKQIAFLGNSAVIEKDAFLGLSGTKAILPQGLLRSAKTLEAEWLSLSFEADETDLAHIIMYQKAKVWQDFVRNSGGDPVLVVDRLTELMSVKKKVSKVTAENVAVYLHRRYSALPRERIAWLLEYLSDNNGKELNALRNDPGFKRYMGSNKAPEPAVAANQSGSTRCSGLTFVITGGVNRFKNREVFTQYVKSQGGKVSGSVTAKTDYLVNNDAASSSTKNRTANTLGVPIITEEQFIECFGFPE